MRVLVTGGTGFIGGSVVADLLASGHDVLALARSDTSAARLAGVGAEPLLGALEDADALQAAASDVDAVIHTAFDNASPLRFLRSARTERRALRAFGGALAGSDRPLVAAGGFGPVLASGPVLTEQDPARSSAGPAGRNVERTIMELADRGVNASIVRLPAVHGDGDRFTVRRIIDIARATGRSAMVGEGGNLLPAVHQLDAARAFRLAVERAVPGSRYHAVAEQGVPFREIAEVIGRRLEIPVVSLSRLAALRQFGVFAPYVASDRPASSAATRAQLGWESAGPGLLEDLDRPEYVAP